MGKLTETCNIPTIKYETVWELRNREKSLRHIAMVVKFVDDNKPKK